MRPFVDGMVHRLDSHGGGSASWRGQNQSHQIVEVEVVTVRIGDQHCIRMRELKSPPLLMCEECGLLWLSSVAR